MTKEITNIDAKIIECKSSEDLTKKCFDWLVSAIKETGAKRVFLPAGGTPISLYKMMEENKDKAFRSVTFVQVDDVVTGSKKGVFKKFFEEHLPSYISQFEFIEDIEIESDALGADLAVLGIGLNGHVAFHEPNIDFGFEFGSVDLSEETVTNLRLEPAAKGRTYGLGHFMKSTKVLLISKGLSKALITAETLQGKSSLPSAKLSYHNDFTLIADTDALSLHSAGSCPAVAIEHSSLDSYKTAG